MVHLAPGTSSTYAYLGNASLSLDPGTFVASASTGTSTITSTGTVTATSASSGSLTSNSSQSATGGQQPYPSEEYLLVGAAVAAVIIAAVLYRVRRSNPTPYPEPGAPLDGGDVPHPAG